MFALNTLLWAARVESDIEIMLDMINGTHKFSSSARLMSNVIVLLNVSRPERRCILILRLTLPLVCYLRWSRCMASLVTGEGEQDSTSVRYDILSSELV